MWEKAFGNILKRNLWKVISLCPPQFFSFFKDGMNYFCHSEYIEDPKEMLSIEDNYYKSVSPTSYQYAMDMTEREAKQAVEGMYHNLNTLQSRSGK